MAAFPAWDLLLFALPSARHTATWIFVLTIVWLRNELARPPLAL